MYTYISLVVVMWVIYFLYSEANYKHCYEMVDRVSVGFCKNILQVLALWRSGFRLLDSIMMELRKQFWND